MAAPTKAASPATTRAILIGTAAVLTLAAGVHIVRYLLLLINRTTLLPPFIAVGSLLVGVVVSLLAIVAVIAVAVTLTSWLIARRQEAFAAFAGDGQGDPRPGWALWAGCVIPFVNLVWAPVFVLELAHAERTQARQRGPITLWWIAWVVAYLICGWAIWTSRATDAQGIADNTVTMIVAYLAGVAVLVLVWRVFDGFVRKPVDRPLHRWVIVSEDGAAEPLNPTASDSPDRPEGSEHPENSEHAGNSEHGVSEQAVVESRDREPAA